MSRINKKKGVSKIYEKKETKKRKLTQIEIRDILSFIHINPYIPHDIATVLYEQELNRHIIQLKKIEIVPAAIPQLKHEIMKDYFCTQIQPGEAVGIIMAQSIGEKQTQGNLNTFHKAGSSDKQPVTSRFAELLNATKDQKNPSCMVYFRGGNDTIPNLRNTIGASLVQVTLESITYSHRIHIGKEQEQWYEVFELIEQPEIPISKFHDCISLKIRMDVLYTYKITLKNVADFLNSMYSEILCVYSPDCFSRIDIFVNTENLAFDDKKLAYVTSENAKQVYLEDVVCQLLMNTLIRGLAGVEAMHFLRESTSTHNGDVKTAELWMVEVENTRAKLPDSVFRFKQILGLPIVDATRTVANNAWVIYLTFGIEATREYMIQEFISIMEGINVCHIILLVDKMLFHGTISSISRYTMRQDESGPFGKASFEETLDNFLIASLLGQQEPTIGVSASIICGKNAPIGSGLCDICMDLDMLSEK